MRNDDDRFEATHIVLANLIVIAYGVKYDRISGPAWIGQDHFQVMAKLPVGSTKRSTPEMMRQLLADRFELRVHSEKRPEMVYELVTGKQGLKLRPAAPGTSQGSFGWPGQVFCRACTLTHLADFISGRNVPAAGSEAQGEEFVEHKIDRPVVDATGLAGVYDIDLQWTPPGGLNLSAIQIADNSRPPRDRTANANSIFGALEGVGLKLQPAKDEFDFLIVDHAARIPSEN